MYERFLITILDKNRFFSCDEFFKTSREEGRSYFFSALHERSSENIKFIQSGRRKNSGSFKVCNIINFFYAWSDQTNCLSRRIGLSCHVCSLQSRRLSLVMSSTYHVFSVLLHLLSLVNFSQPCHVFSVLSRLLSLVTSSQSCHVCSVLSRLLSLVTSS